jgi:hypothetical protein
MIEELDAKRMAYNQRERKFQRQQRNSKTLIGAGFAVSFALSWAKDAGYGMARAAFVGQIFVLFIFVESMLGVLYTSFFYLLAMKKY